jgi:hypothetical protein
MSLDHILNHLKSIHVLIRLDLLELGHSLLCSKEPAAGSYPEPLENNQRPTSFKSLGTKMFIIVITRAATRPLPESLAFSLYHIY